MGSESCELSSYATDGPTIGIGKSSYESRRCIVYFRSIDVLSDWYFKRSGLIHHWFEQCHVTWLTPIHYLNQCRRIIKWIIRIKPPCNFQQKYTIHFTKMHFTMSFATTSFKRLCVDIYMSVSVPWKKNRDRFWLLHHTVWFEYTVSIVSYYLITLTWE